MPFSVTTVLKCQEKYLTKAIILNVTCPSNLSSSSWNDGKQSWIKFLAKMSLNKIRPFEISCSVQCVAVYYTYRLSTLSCNSVFSPSQTYHKELQARILLRSIVLLFTVESRSKRSGYNNKFCHERNFGPDWLSTVELLWLVMTIHAALRMLLLPTDIILLATNCFHDLARRNCCSSALKTCPRSKSPQRLLLSSSAQTNSRMSVQYTLWTVIQ